MKKVMQEPQKKTKIREGKKKLLCATQVLLRRAKQLCATQEHLRRANWFFVFFFFFFNLMV